MRGMSKSIRKVLSAYGIYIVFLAIFLVLSVSNKAFLSTTNLLNILKQASTVSVIAIGMTFTLISGGLDLSAGGVMALAGVCSAKLGLPGGPIVLVPLAVAIAVGAACGAVNGVIAAKGKVPPFIVTLGMSMITRGLALLVTNANPVFGLDPSYIFLGSGKIGNIPVIIFVMIFVLAIATFVLEGTKFGRHIYAIGGNEQAAYISGIKVDGVKILTYVIMGGITGLGGMLLAGRIRSGTPTMAENYELDAIASAVIGGVSTAGGIGRVYGAVIGSLLLTMISNGLDLLNVSAYYQQIIKGMIIIIAVLIDVKTKSVKK